MSEQRLKPCPCCEGMAVLRNEDLREHSEVRVQCVKCGLRSRPVLYMGSMTEPAADAAADWNRRPSAPPPPAEQREVVGVPRGELMRWYSWFGIQAVAHSGELSAKAKAIATAMQRALSTGKARECAACDGRGWHQVDNPPHPFKRVCGTCHGTGKASERQTAKCPKCKAEHEDQDGFGVLKCAFCDYCSHASITNDVCQLCGKASAP